MSEQQRPNERLDTSRDRQVSFRLPLAIDQRLDALAQRAVVAGERTNRRELLSAILFAVDDDGETLGGLLRSYRCATVRDALLDVTTDDNVISFVRHSPGPRIRRTF